MKARRCYSIATASTEATVDPRGEGAPRRQHPLDRRVSGLTSFAMPVMPARLRTEADPESSRRLATAVRRTLAVRFHALASRARELDCFSRRFGGRHDCRTMAASRALRGAR